MGTQSVTSAPSLFFLLGSWVKSCLCVCVYVCVYEPVYVCVYVSMCVCFSLYVSVCLHVSVCACSVYVGRGEVHDAGAQMGLHCGRGPWAAGSGAMAEMTLD